MSSGRYVPPHLRGKGAQPELPPGQRSSGHSFPQGDNHRSFGSRDNFRGGKSFNFRGGNSFGSQDSRRGGGGRRFGGFGRNPITSLGFHGSEAEDPRLEAELFGDSGVTQGINFDKYDDIPVETSGREVPEALDEFNAEILGERMMVNIELAKFSKPTPVQKYSIPIGYVGRDLMACAQTGSGKTGGFLFPLIAQMLRNGAVPTPAGARRSCAYPNALILAPTRELTSQIFEESKKFVYRTGIRPVVIYGGASAREQLGELSDGCDLLVATPGRLVDLIDRGRISLACIAHLVLDEADRMLDMGFEPQIRRIVEEADMPSERQTFMFSATFPREIQQLASDFMRDYIFLAVGRVGSAAADITQTIEYVEGHEKLPRLMQHLNNITDGLILVFVETKKSADDLEFGLSDAGYPATSIHGDRQQYEREAALASFKSGRTPILVATDVASRGLDINNVTHVFNYDMPNTIDDYVHRIGRTGRAGNTGLAVSFINDRNNNLAGELLDLLSENGQEVPTFLHTLVRSRGFSKTPRGRGRGRGGNRFGGRDFRRDVPNNSSSFRGGRGGSRGGSSYRGARGGRGGFRNSASDNSAW